MASNFLGERFFEVIERVCFEDENDGKFARKKCKLVNMWDLMRCAY